MPIDPRSVQWDQPAAPSMTVPVGPRNPRLPAQVQGDVLGNIQTGANTTRTRVQTVGDAIDNTTKGATQPYVVRKARAEAEAAEQGLRFNGLTIPQYQDALELFEKSSDLGPMINNIEQAFRRGPAKTQGFWGLGSILDRLPTPENQAMDAAANKLRGFVKSTQGMTGGENNTVSEMKLNIGSYIPQAADYDSTTVQNLDALRKERARGLRTAVATLGGFADQNGNVTPVPRGYTVGKNPSLDAAIGRMIGNVPPEARSGWILRELNKFNQLMDIRRRASRAQKAPTGASDPEVDGYLKKYGTR